MNSSISRDCPTLYILKEIMHNIHFKKVLRFMLFLSMTFLFLNCGGKDGSSEHKENNDFKLFPDNFFIPDYHESSTLTGKEIEGLKISAFYNLNNDSDSYVINGEYAVLINETITTLGNAEMWLMPSTYRTIYFSNSPTNRRMLAQSKSPPYGYGITIPCTSAGTLPLSAKIGDSGMVATFTYDDGAVENIFWKITDAANDLANLILSTTITDPDGNAKSSEEDIYLIDHEGNRKSITVIMYNPIDDITMTLSGDITY